MKNFQKGSTALVVILLIVALAASALAGGFWYQWQQKEQTNAPVSVNSFNDCVAAGHPVAESHPRQCFVPNGPSFTEEVNDEPVEEVEEYVEYTSQKGEKVRLRTPRADYVIGSPLIIEGQVRGNWSFEASFPLELADKNKKTIAEHHATLQGNWMTEEYVSFRATLSFGKLTGLNEGFLILRKDNPSGLAENDDFVEVPIKF